MAVASIIAVSQTPVQTTQAVVTVTAGAVLRMDQDTRRQGVQFDIVPTLITFLACLDVYTANVDDRRSSIRKGQANCSHWQVNFSGMTIFI